VTKVTSVFPLRAAGIILVALGIVPTAAFIDYRPVVQWLPQAGVEWLVGTLLLVAICWIVARVSGEKMDGFLAAARRALLAAHGTEFAALAALVSLALSLLMTWYITRGLPVGGDELSQRFQATLLLHGRLSAVAEPHPEFVAGVQTLVADNRWFGQFPIGGPALLAMGLLVGAVWLVNPLLAAWTTFSVYQFASRAFDEMTARAATLLFALCPFAILMSGTEQNHPGALAFSMFALASLARWTTADDAKTLRRSAIGVGFGIGAAATVRPYDAALVGVVVGVFQLFEVRGQPRRRRSLAWEILAGAAFAVLLLVVNWRTTGRPLLFAYDALNGAAHRPGFHVDPLGLPFTPLDGLHHASTYLLRLNVSLLNGPLPGMLLVVLPMFLLRSATRWDYLLVAVILVLVAGYGTYWSESFFVNGPRFLYVGVPAFIMFVARAPAALLERAKSPTARRVIPMLLPLAMASAWLMPVRGPAFIGVWRNAESVRGTAADLVGDVAAEAARAGLSNALVFVHESWHGRLTARLRSIGTPSLAAESIVRQFDACALQIGLDVEGTDPGPPSEERMHRIVRRALSAGTPHPVAGLSDQTQVGMVGGHVDEPCVSQLLADRGGAVVPLDFFLPYESFDADGRLGGRVVFVRDYGWRNGDLIDRFGDREWYRYRVRTGTGDTAAVFVPYRPLAAGPF